MRRTFVVVLVGFIAFSGLARAQKGDDWSQFRGPNGQGIAANAKPPTKWSKTENILWKINLPGPGASSPVIFNDRIYLTCYTGFGVHGMPGKMEDLERHLLCLDKDGKVVWKTSIKAKLPEIPSMREGHGYASSTPVVDRDHIYVFFGKTGAFAFTHEGKQVWEADLGDKINGFGSANSPMLFGDLLIVNASIESESLVALDRMTGKEKWKVRNIRESWNSPIVVEVDSKKQLVFAMMGKVLGLEPTTGEQIWSCATEIGWYMVPGLVERDGLIFCTGGRSNQAFAVKAGGKGDVSRSHRTFTFNKGTNVSSPLWHDGHVYWFNDNTATAFCADMKTGKIVFEEKLERANQVYGSPVLADGKIYCVDRSGKTYILAAKPSFEVLATNDLSERVNMFNATPAIWGNRLLIRSDRYLYCIGDVK